MRGVSLSSFCACLARRWTLCQGELSNYPYVLRPTIPRFFDRSGPSYPQITLPRATLCLVARRARRTRVSQDFCGCEFSTWIYNIDLRSFKGDLYPGLVRLRYICPVYTLIVCLPFTGSYTTFHRRPHCSSQATTRPFTGDG